MKFIYYLSLLPFFLAFNACLEDFTAEDLLQKMINKIDSIETIYYKQDMSRSNPRNVNDSIFRYREMYFKRMISDSIVGVKGHWYMYIDDKENVIYEDIYDGNKLVRKNNRDSVARIYDLIKYPSFKQNRFWGHNTLYGMQYEFKYILAHPDSYLIERANDTILGSTFCYHLKVTLKNKMSMPGFATKLEDSEGSISSTSYFIDKNTFYPIKIKMESYTTSSPGNTAFLDQRYYDIEFNPNMDEKIQFNTNLEVLKGYETIEMKPN